MAKTDSSKTSRQKETKAAGKIKRLFTRHKRPLIWGAAALALVLCFLLEQAGVWDLLLDSLGMRPAVSLPAPGTMEVHFLDVGNADAALLLCDGAAMLIDGGELGDGEDLLRYLRSHGVTRLDTVIATHPDADHIGGLVTVVKKLPVDRMLLSYMPQGAEPTTSTYLSLLETVADKGIPAVEAVPGALYPLGSAKVEILGPVIPSADTNDQSVVCRVTHADNRFLFTGDAGEAEEASLLEAGTDLAAQVLKVAHHGSSGSSTAAFLKAVGARLGVISCGADNPYGHPHQGAVTRLKRAGVTLYRTDQKGTVVMISDGHDIEVRTER